MWKDIEDIYTKLQDDESRLIFRKRFEYNLCGDASELWKMASTKEDATEKSLYTLLLNKEKYPKEQPIIIFGACRWGGFRKTVIEDYKVGKIVCYCDNKKTLHGTVFKDLPVLSVEEACEKYPNALFVIESRKFNQIMKDQLRSLGIPEENIFGYIYNERIYGWQYFEKDIIRTEVPDGIFIDGGCLDLEDSRRFTKYNPQYKKIYAFEPEKANYELCLKRKESLLKNDDRVEIINKGLWSEEKELNFVVNGGSSHIAEGGEDSVKVTSIDLHVKENEKVTLIKMDIEGAELEALHGAKRVIMKDKPDLAICIYHKNEDIIDIPKYILELNPDYKFYIRHYSCYKWETVLYAVSDS